ncbi:hypothetical protein [Chitinophaga sp. MM2321]|uniref:hypothetical protein n=1 Tax=Chitinophaga sp. MM2321 TaxID=3137178 RepID=UPI0032D59ECB
MTAYNNDDVIRYVEEEMLPEERQRFEAALKADAELAAAVAAFRTLKDTLVRRLPPDAEADLLQEELQRRRDTYFKHPPKVISMRKYLVGFAAAAAILIAAVVVFRHNGEMDYMAIYGNIEMQASVERGDNKDSLLRSAALFFNERAYTKVIPLLNEYLEQDSSSQMAHFYRGVAQLRGGSVEAGLAELETVYAGASLFKYDAAFYTALYYAQQHNKKEARTWLDKIPADAAIAAKAAALEKELR